MITEDEFQAAFREVVRPLTIMQRLAMEIANKAGVTTDDMRGRDRSKLTVRARQLFMYKAHREGVAMAEIGRFLNRDHTTVMHGIRKIEANIHKHQKENGTWQA